MRKAGQVNKYTSTMFKQQILQNGLLHHKVDGYKEVRICYNNILILSMCSMFHIWAYLLQYIFF